MTRAASAKRPPPTVSEIDDTLRIRWDRVYPVVRIKRPGPDSELPGSETTVASTDVLTCADTLVFGERSGGVRDFLGWWCKELDAERHPWVLVVGGDMPKCDPRILGYLHDKCAADIHVVVPRWESGFLEPLSAIYRKELQPHIDNVIQEASTRGKYPGLHKVLNDLAENPDYGVCFLDIEPMVERGELLTECFRNVNRPSDLSTLEKNSGQ